MSLHISPRCSFRRFSGLAWQRSGADLGTLIPPCHVYVCRSRAVQSVIDFCSIFAVKYLILQQSLYAEACFQPIGRSQYLFGGGGYFKRIKAVSYFSRTIASKKVICTSLVSRWPLADVCWCGWTRTDPYGVGPKQRCTALYSRYQYNQCVCSWWEILPQRL